MSSLVAYGSSDNSSDEDQPSLSPPKPRIKKKIPAFNKNKKSFGIQLSLTEKTFLQNHNNTQKPKFSGKNSDPTQSSSGVASQSDNDSEDEDNYDRHGRKNLKRSYNGVQIEPLNKSRLLNQLSTKKAVPVHLKKKQALEKKQVSELVHKQDIEAELALEESFKNAKSADKLFSKLSAAAVKKASTDDLFIDATYRSGPVQLTLGKNSCDQKLPQSYMNRLVLSKGAVSIVQDDIAKNQAKATLAHQKMLEKYMKKEEDRKKMPEVADIVGVKGGQGGSSEDIGGFFNFENKKLTAGEVIGTIEELGIDLKDEANNYKMPNPFAQTEEADYIPEQTMGYTDAMSGDAYTIYNLPWDKKTEKLNYKGKDREELQKLGNQQIDMNKVYRLAGNRKIQGEKLNMVDLDNKAQMADQQHVQKHLAVFNRIAVNGHVADKLAEESDISRRSKNKNQVTHLMNEAIRNKERLENFWADSKEGAQKSKGKYGWGFGFVN